VKTEKMPPLVAGAEAKETNRGAAEYGSTTAYSQALAKLRDLLANGVASDSYCSRYALADRIEKLRHELAVEFGAKNDWLLGKPFPVHFQLPDEGRRALQTPERHYYWTKQEEPAAVALHLHVGRCGEVNPLDFPPMAENMCIITHAIGDDFWNPAECELVVYLVIR
jgi:hypothetical protein